MLAYALKNRGNENGELWYWAAVVLHCYLSLTERIQPIVPPRPNTLSHSPF